MNQFCIQDSVDDPVISNYYFSDFIIIEFWYYSSNFYIRLYYFGCRLNFIHLHFCISFGVFGDELKISKRSFLADFNQTTWTILQFLFLILPRR